jgi:adenylyl- and sulfurtransferase ThiI
MFKKAKEMADKEGIDLIVSGEVLYERPMSQMPKGLKIIEEKSGLKEK